MWKVNDDGQRNMAMVHLNGKKEKHKKQTHLKQYPPTPKQQYRYWADLFYLIKLKVKTLIESCEIEGLNMVHIIWKLNWFHDYLIMSMRFYNRKIDVKTDIETIWA